MYGALQMLIIDCQFFLMKDPGNYVSAILDKIELSGFPKNKIVVLLIQPSCKIQFAFENIYWHQKSVRGCGTHAITLIN